MTVDTTDTIGLEPSWAVRLSVASGLTHSDRLEKAMGPAKRIDALGEGCRASKSAWQS